MNAESAAGMGEGDDAHFGLATRSWLAEADETAAGIVSEPAGYTAYGSSATAGPRHRFKELKIWQKAMSLAQLTYERCAGFPDDERFGLISQMRRAAVSVPSNIAEGAGRGTNRDFAHFLSISTGSVYELETQFLLAISFGYLTQERYAPIGTQLNELQRMLYSFRQTILSSLNP